MKPVGKLRSLVLKALGIPVHLTDAEFWARHAGTASTSGQSVSEQSMMRLSTVWACVRLISEVIATLPLSMYEKTSAGPAVAQQHPLQLLIHDIPNPDATASVFWESVVAAMLLRGAARVERMMIGDRLVGLNFLVPGRLSPIGTAATAAEWRYTNDDGTQRVIPTSRIWTIPGFSLDGKCGVSVIQYGVNVFGAAQAAELAAANTWEKGLLPTVYFSMANLLTKAQRAQFRENMAGIRGAINAGESPLLEAGMKAEAIGIEPADAQLLESRAFSVEEICRWFRVPPFMVGHSEKSTSWGTGIEQQMIGFLTFTLRPWLVRIEQSIRKDLLAPVERLRFYPKFAVEGLLRADSESRASFYSVMVSNGILTRDEVRALEDRQPMGGNAAVLTVQSAMTPLESIGAGDEQMNQARAALRALLGFDAKKE